LNRLKNASRSDGSGPETFFVSDNAKAAGETGWPDIQMQQFGAEEVDAKDGSMQSSVIFIFGRPKSVGSITLDTKRYLQGERDSAQLAIIDYNLFGVNEDKERFIQGNKQL